MKNLTTYTMYENIILEGIDLESYDIKAESNFDKVNAAHKVFLSEYGFAINRMGEVKAFKEWLQGLPTVVSVPFYNNEILAIGYVNNYIKADATEEEEDNFLNEWFFNLAKAFFVLKENL